MKHGNLSVFIPHLGCPNQCSFCNQKAITGHSRAPSVKEVEAVLEEACQGLRTPPEETEIAFFGGSFTAVEPAYMEGLLKTGQSFVRRFGLKGIRVSTRPDRVDTRVLALLKEYGVTAVELGAQSMDDRVLSLNRRGHTAKAVEEASRRIQEMGMELGLQMMTGLYGQTGESAWETAKALAALGPDTVRIYPTVVLRGTYLHQLLEQGVYRPQTLEEGVSLCSGLLLFFHRLGIPVIKLGLHASQEVERDRVGGAYHPAFRELCESRIYWQLAREQLLAAQGSPSVIRVGPSMVSKMVGQKRANLTRLEEEFGRKFWVKTDAGLGQYALYLENREES